SVRWLVGMAGGTVFTVLSSLGGEANPPTGRLGIFHFSLHRKADGEVNPTACRLGDLRDSAADLVGWTEAINLPVGVFEQSLKMGC
ncbi:MAG TPA: hypothetical protein VGV87_16495, partial [Blastocatellia bacterium]|nr:hypothetical protein [Blastocatellia bacterium]